jgi:putative toxin-antitoxin system antitoxin component (TIGR02293 family)
MATRLPLGANWRIIVGQVASATSKSVRIRTSKGTVQPSAAKSKGSGWERFRTFLETGGPGANSYVVLLGLETFDSRQLLRSVEQGLPYSVFDRLVANTSLPSDAALVLVNIPRRTLTRRKREGRFHQDESDRLVRASRVFARALSLFEGNREAAKHWLSAPQKAVGGEVPLALARTETGALEVERLMGRLEHGVFT